MCGAIVSGLQYLSMNGMPRAQDAHDCMDAGGRATQEQLPRSGVCQFRTAHQSMCGAIVSVLHGTSIVRRDCSRFAQCLKFAARRASHGVLHVGGIGEAGRDCFEIVPIGDSRSVKKGCPDSGLW
jgi:hypothetical protein